MGVLKRKGLRFCRFRSERKSCATSGFETAHVSRIGGYLNPKSMQNNSPKPIEIAPKAIVPHTFGVQVLGVQDVFHQPRTLRGILVDGLGCWG